MYDESLEQRRDKVESPVVEALLLDLEREFNLLRNHRCHPLEHLLLFVAKRVARRGVDEAE